MYAKNVATDFIVTTPTSQFKVPTAAPANVRPYGAASSHVNFVWDEITSGGTHGDITGYEYQMLVNGHPVTNITYQSQTFTDESMNEMPGVNVTGVRCGTGIKYTFQVAGKNSAGLGPFENYTFSEGNFFSFFFITSFTTSYSLF